MAPACHRLRAKAERGTATLQVHGTQDWVVPCSHGRTLQKLAPNSHEPLWCHGRGHNDLPEEDVFSHLRDFLDDLRVESADR